MEDMKSGAGEFALWNGFNIGYCYYRHTGKYFLDCLNYKEPHLGYTKEITKAEYLKGLAKYGKTLQNERM